MGPGSSITPDSIHNSEARVFFVQYKAIFEQVSSENPKRHIELARCIHRFLKHAPAANANFALTITGSGLGPLFLNSYAPRLRAPNSLVQISLRKAGLDSTHSLSVANFLKKNPSLTHFDASANKFGDLGKVIIDAAVGHPGLKSFQLEGCGLTDGSWAGIHALVATSRRMTYLSLTGITLSRESRTKLNNPLNSNFYLQSLSLDSETSQVASYLASRNDMIREVMEGLVRAPFLKNFARKVASFKSVKGRELAVNRARERENLAGTEALQRIEAADERSATTHANARREASELLRCGRAETVGRRPSMEDVSIVSHDFPRTGAVLYGLFDGHGGREAAEYASLNLPLAIQSRLISSSRWEDAYTHAFRQTQSSMEQWCQYVGTTVVLAVVEDLTLTVANVGDSRAVLFREGRAIRLTVDHKPDLPEEMSYITSKGGFVNDGRANGMLAVSRALGDGFLRNAANPTPHLQRMELTEQDSLLILACDGVWDVMSDQEACELIAGQIDPLEAAITIRDRAYELSSMDNISVIVVFFTELLTNGLTHDD
jgi:serine/threonine protein phosphatase PrpC